MYIMLYIYIYKIYTTEHVKHIIYTNNKYNFKKIVQKMYAFYKLYFMN